MIYNEDSLIALKEISSDFIDVIITDPPYGYSFMGKDWDKAVPSVDIWKQCLRVLKPGAFMCVMSAPRSDVQNAMISRLMEAGFRLDFTPTGRFPANLLVENQVLNGHSKYFDLDAWADTLPFLIVPKASKSEKNKGLEHLEEKESLHGSYVGRDLSNPKTHLGGMQSGKAKNHHPTVKPLKLMSYLITLFSREGDIVLDPFVGSGTTIVAAKQLNRKGIGIERELEYAEIAKARLEAVEEDKQMELI